jgi:DNA-binding PadR family transcriptional regulator
MSLKHALLGFLNYGPMTGYELKKFFDHSVAHFWNAELSQIYPSLKQLQSEGLVEMKVDVQEDRPNRKVYKITDKGHGELLQWLGQPAEPDQLREPLLIKVFFGASGGKEQVITVLRQRIDELKKANAEYEMGHQMIGVFANSIGMEKEGVFWDMTIECGLRHNRASIEWAENVIQRVQALPEEFFSQARAPLMDSRLAVEIIDRAKGNLPVVPVSTVAAGERSSTRGQEVTTNGTTHPDPGAHPEPGRA